jgi:simple sugar transport system substrate-binding protein
MSRYHFPHTRRTFLTGLTALSAGALAASVPGGRARSADLTVGFIYVGPRDDFGYNQAHAQGADAVKKMTGVKVIEQENVPETAAVEKTMASMINLDAAPLLFPTSFGYYDPHILNMAPKYSDTTFMHCGGLWQEGHPDNAHSYFGYIDEAQYLNGIVAGHATRSKKLGFVAAKPIPQVLRNVNAFTLGAQSVDPEITTQVIFTGDWALPVKEAEATNSLADQGADVVTMHVDSPKVTVETAAKRDMFVCGYHASQAPLAPDLYLTGAEWNWPQLYPSFVSDFQAGESIPNMVRGGLRAGIVKTSDYGPAVSDKAAKQADAVKAEFMSEDGFVIFKGPIKSNAGKTVIPEGTAYEQTAIELEKMDYLVQGVIGSTS